MCYSAIIRQDLRHLEKCLGSIEIRYQGDMSLDNIRVYPGGQAAVITLDHAKVTAQQMRYGTFPPATILNPKNYTSYNARLDNIRSSFWSNAFMVGHGIVNIRKFYEWVAVEKLFRFAV